MKAIPFLAKLDMEHPKKNYLLPDSLFPESFALMAPVLSRSFASPSLASLPLTTPTRPLISRDGLNNAFSCAELRWKLEKRNNWTTILCEASTVVKKKVQLRAMLISVFHCLLLENKDDLQFMTFKSCRDSKIFFIFICMHFRML